MFSTCITPRFYQNYFTIFWYFFFFFFIAYLFIEHIFTRFAFFFRFLRGSQCMTLYFHLASIIIFGQRVYLVSHYPHIWYSTYMNALMVTDIKYKFFLIIPMMGEKKWWEINIRIFNTPLSCFRVMILVI